MFFLRPTWVENELDLATTLLPLSLSHFASFFGLRREEEEGGPGGGRPERTAGAARGSGGARLWEMRHTVSLRL